MKSLILLGLLMAAPTPQEQVGTCCPHSSHARPDYTGKRRRSHAERPRESKGKPDRNKDDK
jgi:hypothetical protein